MKPKNRLSINLINIISTAFLLFILSANQATATIIYQDTFNGTAGTLLETYNTSWSRYGGGDSIFLTGGYSIYTPIYALEFYSGTYTSTQGIQFDFITNFSQGKIQQFAIEVYAQGPGNRAEDIYLNIGTDGGANIINQNNTSQKNFPAGYFSDNTTYTLFASYNGSVAEIYLNGSKIYSFNGNNTGYSSGSFGIQLRNNACIGNLFYTDSATPHSIGPPSPLTCPIPDPPAPPNQPPIINNVTAPSEPVIVNSSVNINAAFTDQNSADMHTAVWDWGDGTKSSGEVLETSGSGTTTANHAYSSSGIYTVEVSVSDKEGATDTESYQYIIVYDPSAGHVSGGGTITSPQAAYVKDPELSGMAIFGFASKYKKGETVPAGHTEFNFIKPNFQFKFKSTSYDWLVAKEQRAWYKGSGTVNESGDFAFILSLLDTKLPGREERDKFRLKIWDKSTEEVIYDNQIGASYTEDPTADIDNGSIVIHN